MGATGCQKTPVAEEVNRKLDKVHRIVIPKSMPMNIEAMPPIEDYHATNNPFVLPSGVSPTPDNTQETLDAVLVDDRFKASATNAKEALDLGVKYGRSVNIDTSRVRQTLENHPLDSLSYRGRIEHDDQISALVLSPDGIAHPVRVGQYLGKNHGKVSHINHHEIVIQEAILQEDGRYYEQVNYLRFYP